MYFLMFNIFTLFGALSIPWGGYVCIINVVITIIIITVCKHISIILLCIILSSPINYVKLSREYISVIYFY